MFCFLAASQITPNSVAWLTYIDLVIWLCASRSKTFLLFSKLSKSLLYIHVLTETILHEVLCWPEVLWDREYLTFRIFRLEKTWKIFKSKHQPSITTMFTIKPCPLGPYRHGFFWTLPVMMIPSLDILSHPFYFGP